MFESTGVMTRKELEARNEVKWETYTKKIQIEARVLGDLAMNHIIPTATRYQTSLIDNVYKMKDLFPADKASALSSRNLEIIEDIANRTNFIKEKVDEMVEARKVANKIESEREKAIAYHDKIVPMLEAIRYHIDKLELVVDDQIWTLPKYRELLFSDSFLLIVLCLQGERAVKYGSPSFLLQRNCIPLEHNSIRKEFTS